VTSTVTSEIKSRYCSLTLPNIRFILIQLLPFFSEFLWFPNLITSLLDEADSEQLRLIFKIFSVIVY
jgi:hypothetical protein